MGRVIYLHERRPVRIRAIRQDRPTFFFDVSSPLSYLMAERIERTLGEVTWVAADGSLLRRARNGRDRGHNLQGLRGRAEAAARAMRLPLVWPERFPGSAPCAQRAADFACEIGAGAAFALAASRLAFCGGFDLEDPETLAEAAAAAGVPLEGCLAAAGETWRDEELAATVRQLADNGVTEVPAIRVGRRWAEGEQGLLTAQLLLNEAGADRAC